MSSSARLTEVSQTTFLFKKKNERGHVCTSLNTPPFVQRNYDRNIRDHLFSLFKNIKSPLCASYAIPRVIKDKQIKN